MLLIGALHNDMGHLLAGLQEADIIGEKKGKHAKKRSQKSKHHGAGVSLVSLYLFFSAFQCDSHTSSIPLGN
jgi:hypothetical protein